MYCLKKATRRGHRQLIVKEHRSLKFSPVGQLCSSSSLLDDIGLSPGCSPWVIKQARGAGVPSVGRYNMIKLTSPVVLGIIDGLMLTGVTYFGGSGRKADNRVVAETTVAAEN
uniref:Uncharacterized protein n=1 Tax=Romanomermis culicivorax TaxID=13658 RepID=A0A915KL56_ROMCU